MVLYLMMMMMKMKTTMMMMVYILIHVCDGSEPYTVCVRKN